MYCLRVLLLFYMNYIHNDSVDVAYSVSTFIICILSSPCTLCVYCDYFGVLIDCCVSELHAKLCPHHNVWPEIVYCCFTRTTPFIELFTWFLIGGRGFYHFTKFHCSTPSSSEIAKCIA